MLEGSSPTNAVIRKPNRSTTSCSLQSTNQPTSENETKQGKAHTCPASSKSEMDISNAATKKAAKQKSLNTITSTMDKTSRDEVLVEVISSTYSNNAGLSPCPPCFRIPVSDSSMNVSLQLTSFDRENQKPLFVLLKVKFGFRLPFLTFVYSRKAQL